MKRRQIALRLVVLAIEIYDLEQRSIICILLVVVTLLVYPRRACLRIYFLPHRDFVVLELKKKHAKLTSMCCCELRYSCI